jgi:hypothetical protein
MYELGSANYKDTDDRSRLLASGVNRIPLLLERRAEYRTHISCAGGPQSRRVE